MFSVLVAIGAGIVLTEAGIWILLRRKIADVHFPRSMDTSSLRFFSPQRLALLNVLHALFLLCSTLFPLWFLW
jgi:hypothetical protein